MITKKIRAYRLAHPKSTPREIATALNVKISNVYATLGPIKKRLNAPKHKYSTAIDALKAEAIAIQAVIRFLEDRHAPTI